MPTVYEAAIFSEAVYSREKQTGLKDWEILTTATKQGLDLLGYDGCAYINHNTKEIVIAHRGTVPSLSFDLFFTLGSDASIYNENIPTAYYFAKEFTDKVNELNKEHYTITYTGHSLGAAYSIMLGVYYQGRVIAFDTVAPDSLTKLIENKFNWSPEQIKKFAESNIISVVAPRTFINDGTHLGKLLQLGEQPSQRKTLERHQSERGVGLEIGMGCSGIICAELLSKAHFVKVKHSITTMRELIFDSKYALITFPEPKSTPSIADKAKRSVIQGSESTAIAAEQKPDILEIRPQPSNFFKISIHVERAEPDTKISNPDPAGNKRVDVEQIQLIIKKDNESITKLKNLEPLFALTQTAHVLANLLNEYQQMRFNADVFKKEKAGLVRKIEEEARKHNIRIELSDMHPHTKFTLPEIQTEIIANTYISYSLMLLQYKKGCDTLLKKLDEVHAEIITRQSIAAEIDKAREDIQQHQRIILDKIKHLKNDKFLPTINTLLKTTSMILGPLSTAKAIATSAFISYVPFLTAGLVLTSAVIDFFGSNNRRKLEKKLNSLGQLAAMDSEYLSSYEYINARNSAGLQSLMGIKSVIGSSVQSLEGSIHPKEYISAFGKLIDSENKSIAYIDEQIKKAQDKVDELEEITKNKQDPDQCIYNWYKRKHNISESSKRLTDDQGTAKLEYDNALKLARTNLKEISETLGATRRNHVEELSKLQKKLNLLKNFEGLTTYSFEYLKDKFGIIDTGLDKEEDEEELLENLKQVSDKCQEYCRLAQQREMHVQTFFTTTGEVAVGIKKIFEIYEQHKRKAEKNSGKPGEPHSKLYEQAAPYINSMPNVINALACAAGIGLQLEKFIYRDGLVKNAPTKISDNSVVQSLFDKFLKSGAVFDGVGLAGMLAKINPYLAISSMVITFGINAWHINYPPNDPLNIALKEIKENLDVLFKSMVALEKTIIECSAKSLEKTYDAINWSFKKICEVIQHSVEKSETNLLISLSSVQAQLESVLDETDQLRAMIKTSEVKNDNFCLKNSIDAYKKEIKSQRDKIEIESRKYMPESRKVKQDELSDWLCKLSGEVEISCGHTIELPQVREVYLEVCKDPKDYITWLANELNYKEKFPNPDVAFLAIEKINDVFNKLLQEHKRFTVCSSGAHKIFVGNKDIQTELFKIYKNLIALQDFICYLRTDSQWILTLHETMKTAYGTIHAQVKKFFDTKETPEAITQLKELIAIKQKEKFKDADLDKILNEMLGEKFIGSHKFSKIQDMNEKVIGSDKYKPQKIHPEYDVKLKGKITACINALKAYIKNDDKGFMLSFKKTTPKTTTISEVTMIFPAESHPTLQNTNYAFLPLLLPKKYIDDVENIPIIRGFLDGEQLGTWAIKKDYEIRRIFEGNIDHSFQLILHYYVLPPLATEPKPCAQVIIATIDARTIFTFRKIKSTGGQHTYDFNYNEFLLLFFYGSVLEFYKGNPGDAICGLPGKDSIILSTSCCKLQLHCPVEYPFPGLYFILPNMPEPSTFTFQDSNYDATLAKPLYDMAFASSKISEENATKLHSFFTKGNFLACNLSIYAQIMKAISKRGSGILSKFQESKEYQKACIDLSRSYATLLTSIQLFADIDNATLRVLVTENLRIIPPEKVIEWLVNHLTYVMSSQAPTNEVLKTIEEISKQIGSDKTSYRLLRRDLSNIPSDLRLSINDNLGKLLNWIRQVAVKPNRLSMSLSFLSNYQSTPDSPKELHRTKQADEFQANYDAFKTMLEEMYVGSAKFTTTDKYKKPQVCFLEYDKQLKTMLNSCLHLIDLFLNNRSTEFKKFTNQSISDCEVVFSVKSKPKLLPLLFPKKYLDKIENSTVVKMLKMAERFGVCTVKKDYELKPIYFESGVCIRSFQLQLNYYAMDSQPCFTFVVAEFDAATVHAFSKITKVEDADKYKQQLNLNEFLIILWFGSIITTETDPNPENRICGLPGAGTKFVRTKSDSILRLVYLEELPFVGLYKILANMYQLSTFNFKCCNYDKTVMNGLYDIARSNLKFSESTTKKIKAFFVQKDFIITNLDSRNNLFKQILAKHPTKYLEIIDAYEGGIRQQTTSSTLWFEREGSSSSASHCSFFSSEIRSTHSTVIDKSQKSVPIKSKEMRLEDKSDFSPMPTKGDGNCSFHAVFGEWNPDSKQYEAKNASALRIEMANVIRRHKVTKPELGDLICHAINAGLDNNLFNSSYPKLMQLKKEKEKFYLRPASAWERFEDNIANHQDILQYINEATPQKNQEDFKNQFIRCYLQTTELRKKIDAVPELQRLYKDYDGITKQEFTCDLNQAILDEYANFIQRDGQWLLPVEVKIMAVALNRKVHFFNRNREKQTIIGPDHFNDVPGIPEVTIIFNGKDHYERMSSNKKYEQSYSTRSLEIASFR